MFKIGNVFIKNQICIAPMAGITDLPYRLILKSFGASLMTTELISAKGIIYGTKGNEHYMATDRKEAPIAVQLFGNDKNIILNAAVKIMDDYDMIDINMGCPVPKLVRNGEGSALMKEPKVAAGIIKTLVDEIGNIKPITAKIRIGFDNNNINAVEFAKVLEDAGVFAITIHGRTRTEMYSGKCHIDVIKKVKEAVKIPVIANGNIFTKEDAKFMLDETKCEGIALGRGIKGNPWLVRECIEYINNNNTIERPSLEEIKKMMIYHIEKVVEFRGLEQAINELKHHLFWYTSGIENSAKFRRNLNNVDKLDDLYKLIDDFFIFI